MRQPLVTSISWHCGVVQVGRLIDWGRGVGERVGARSVARVGVGGEVVLHDRVRLKEHVVLHVHLRV